MARDNQRNRTRKDLLEAALRLSSAGNKPTLEQVAEEALVSRATAYRYFRNADDLLLEASLHVAFPDARQVLDMEERDPIVRMKVADEAVAAMIEGNEASLRIMLANAIERAGSEDGLPIRQNRRMPLIEAALEPSREWIDDTSLARLKAGLSLVIGTESLFVLKDVLQLSGDEARAVRHWVIEALIKAATKAPVGK